MGLLELSRRAFRKACRQVDRLAPAGSWRRAVLRQLYCLLRHRRFGPMLLPPIKLQPLPDLFDRAALNHFLAVFGIQFPARLCGPVMRDTAARRVLELLVSDPELRQRFPLALRERSCGEFARWLFSSEAECHGVSGAAARLLVEALDRRPGLKVLHLYDHEPHLQKLFPLALTPVDRTEFLHWLLTHRTQHGFSEDEVLWFIFEAAEDPAAGLAETFRRLPAWQEAIPHGLTRFGWGELKRWAAVRHQLSGDWLDRAERPDTLRPVEELHWLTVARPDLKQRYPDVLTNPTPARALAREIDDDEAGWRWWLEVDLAGFRPGTNLLAHFRYPSGLQVAALNTAAALESAGFIVSRRDVITGVPTDVPGRDGFLDLHPYPVTISQLAPEPLAEECYELSGLGMRNDTYRIGYWYWELEDVPPAWQRHTRWLHELWAPTRFIGEALRHALPLPVVDMLAGMRMPPIVERPRSYFGLPDDRFLFLFVFDMCSTFERKNPLAVVDAFRRAFTPREPVALAIKVSRGYHDPVALHALQEACARDGVFLIDSMLPHDDLFGLMNCCDGYVSLHRSEGYGLTLAEAMALGKPVIATGYSGNLDFMTPANSLLVSYALVPLRTTVHVYRRGSRWAEPAVDHAAELMRWVVKHPAEATGLGQRAARAVRATLSLEAAGQRMAARLHELTSRRAVRAAG